jgi:hypothetical protein
MHIAAISTNRTICDSISKLEVEERCQRSMHLDAVLPELAMAADLTEELRVANCDRTELPLDACCSIE